MKKVSITLMTSLLCLVSSLSFGQKKINLADEYRGEQVMVVNRSITLYGENSAALELNAAKGDGLGILEEISFEAGTIEIELLGENNPGKSFIGIAFNIVDEDTYEAIYFRPFNFVAAEQIRKEHMVQYIHHPEFTWYKLRENRTGEFENEISTPPDPDDWFKARIEISETSVQVYVNDHDEPVLKVDRLTSTGSGKIGLWTGNGSSGRFRNLVLLKE